MNFTKEDLEKKSDLELATIARKHGVWNYFLRKTLVLDIIIPTLSSAKTVYDLGIALKELEEKLENFVREHGLSELDEVHYDQKTNQIQIFLLSLPETNIEREFLINSLLKTNE